MPDTLPEPGRVLIHNARIYPDASGAGAAALLIEGGRVRWLGQAGEALPPAERTIDAGGRTVLPSFIDAHAHLWWLAMDRLVWQLSGPQGPDSIGGLLEALHERARDGEPWVVGHGLSEARLAERRLPTRAELDAVVPDRPVVLRRACGHAAVANTAALRRAGYRDDSPDPEGGLIERENGVPNGVLREAAALPLYPLLPRPSTSRLIESLHAVARQALSLGVGTVGEAAVGFTAGFEAEWDVWRAVRAQGRFPLRMGFMFAIGATEAALRGLRPDPDPHWRADTLKCFSDGTLGSQTAALHQPYCACSQRKGLLMQAPRALRHGVAAAADAGWQVAIHAIGDSGVDEALGALEAAAPLADGRPHRIEHLGLLSRAALDRLAATRAAVVTQPSFIGRMGDAFAATLGAERAERLYPARGLIERGVLLVGSSDAPAGDLSPLRSMADARERRTPSGRVLGANERLSAAQALRCHTENAAAAMGLGDRVGHLRVGAQADLVLVDTDPFEADAARLRQTKVLLHLRAGQPVWEAGR